MSLCAYFNNVLVTTRLKRKWEMVSSFSSIWNGSMLYMITYSPLVTLTVLLKAKIWSTYRNVTEKMKQERTFCCTLILISILLTNILFKISTSASCYASFLFTFTNPSFLTFCIFYNDHKQICQWEILLKMIFHNEVEKNLVSARRKAPSAVTVREEERRTFQNDCIPRAYF